MIISKTKLIIFSIVASLFIFNSTALATPVDDALIEQDIIMYNISVQQQTLDKLSNEYDDALIKQEEIQNSIRQLENQVSKTEQELQHNQLALQAQCINIYKYGDMPVINVITDANNFEEFVVNLDFCNKIVEQTDKTIDKNIALKQSLQGQKDELNIQEQELKEEMQRIDKAKEEAESCIASLENEYSQLTEEIATLILKQQTTPAFLDVIENVGANDYIISNSVLNTNSLAEAISQSEEFAAYAEKTGASANEIVERAYSMIGSPYV